MLIYVYDGSFEGLLTAIYEAYYRRERPQKMLSSKNLQSGFLDQFVHIETDEDKSSKVYQSVKSKISRMALHNVYYVFLSEDPDKGTIIYDYLRFGWVVGPSVDERLSDDRVLRVHKISQRVGLERHRMFGFVRFKLLAGNVYYAPIEPDNNIVELLAPHFVDRLTDQNWIIHDVRRNLAAVYNGAEWVMVNTTMEKLPELNQDELEYQRLWKEFFESIAISNRYNPKLQKRSMPVRYWKYLTEKC